MHSWFHGCSHCPMYMNQYMNSLMVLMTLLLMVVLKGRGQIPNSMTFVMHTFIFKAALSSSAVILFKSPCSFEQSVESQLRSSTNLKLLMWSPCIFTWFFLYHIIKQFKKHTNVNQMQKKKKIMQFMEQVLQIIKCIKSGLCSFTMLQSWVNQWRHILIKLGISSYLKTSWGIYWLNWE